MFRRFWGLLWDFLVHRGLAAKHALPDPHQYMPKVKYASLQDHFAALADPRRREVVSPLINVVAVAIGAVLGGAFRA